MRKGRETPNPKKTKKVDWLKNKISNIKVLGLADLSELPSSALLNIKFSLHDNAEIRVMKKIIVEKALEGTKFEKILEIMDGQPALIFSDVDPFKLYNTIKRKKTPISAKVGDIAPEDIIVPAGPTDLAPGPAITVLSKVGIKSKVEGGKIAIIKDKTICTEGKELTEDMVAVLNLLGLKPMETNLNILGIFEDGMLYKKDVLSIDEEMVYNDIILGIQQALNLTVEIAYPTKDNINLLITKAFREAKSLSLEANIISKDIIGELLAKAVREAKALEEQVGDLTPKEKPLEKVSSKDDEKKKEKPEEVKEEKNDNQEGGNEK